MYRQGLQEGVDTGHHARQGSTFFAAFGASISSFTKAEKLAGGSQKLPSAPLNADIVCDSAAGNNRYTPKKTVLCVCIRNICEKKQK